VSIVCAVLSPVQLRTTFTRLPAPPTDDPPSTPMYDSLTTNLPHPVMAYTSFSFPPSTPLFPPAATVQTYLESYAAHFDLMPLIRLRTTVQHTQWESASGKWNIQLSSGDTRQFDFIIVANGHYRVPRYPSIPGLSDWIAARKASHSAWYRRPHNFGEVVLVIGGGPSGQDIAAEMCTVARTVIHSVTGGVSEDLGNLKKRGRVIAFKEGGQVLFDDGTTEFGVDYCLLATGYELSFPFLSSGIIQSGFPPSCPPVPRRLYNSGYHIFPLAKQMFPLQTDYPPSSIAFMGLLVKVAPFPLLEAQGRAVMKVFENPASLDTTQEAVDIITRYEELRSEFGDDTLSISKSWHKYKDQKQFDYRDQLHQFAEGDADTRTVVMDWEKEMYGKKDMLRIAWRKLEKSGEANDWVKGVGEGGPTEWVDLMRRLLEMIGEEEEDRDKWSKL
jgi:hypothetical protein